MKPLRNLLYTLTGATLTWGVFAPLFFLIIMPISTAVFYLMFAVAHITGRRGTKEWRRAVTRWHAAYSRITASTFAFIMCMRIRVRIQTGPKIIPGKSYIVIANHISWFDPVFFPSLCARIGVHNMRCVVKESFKRYRMAHVILTRSWDESGFPFVTRSNARIDIKRIEDGSRMALEDDASMLIFCEGTRQPDEIIGKPKWRGFAAQENLFKDCQIVSLTQCFDKPVGTNIWKAHTHFLRSLLVEVQVYEPLPDGVDRKTWLEIEFERKADVIKSIRVP